MQETRNLHRNHSLADPCTYIVPPCFMNGLRATMPDTKCLSPFFSRSSPRSRRITYQASLLSLDINMGIMCSLQYKPPTLMKESHREAVMMDEGGPGRASYLIVQLHHAKLGLVIWPNQPTNFISPDLIEKTLWPKCLNSPR